MGSDRIESKVDHPGCVMEARDDKFVSLEGDQPKEQELVAGGCIVHVHTVPARPARYGMLKSELHPNLKDMLRSVLNS